MDNSQRPSVSSKSVLYQNSTSIIEARRTKLEKNLIFLVAIFFITTSIFLSLFVYVYIMYENAETTRLSQQIDISIERECTTPECIQTAAQILKNMDHRVSPCEDFYQYACGTFIREQEIPEGHSSVSHMNLIAERNQKVVREIMETESDQTAPRYLTLIRDLYTACVDEDKMEKAGLDAYLQLPLAKEWPTINPDWDNSTFDLTQKMVTFAAEFDRPIIDFSVTVDVPDPTKHVLRVDQPKLLLRGELYSGARNDSKLQASEQFYVDIAVELGADPEIARQDAIEYVDFEKQLAKLLISRQKIITVRVNEWFKPISIEELRELIHYVDMPRVIQASFSLVNMTLTPDHGIVVPNPDHFPFFKDLGELLSKTSARVLSNLFGFKYARSRISHLTKRLRDISTKLSKAVAGKSESPPRSKTCRNWVSDVFGQGIAKEFVKRTFSSDDKHYLDDLINNLKASFRHLLKSVKWIGEDTRKEALEKLDMMSQKIGFPDTKFGEEDIDALFENYTITKDDHFANILEIKKMSEVRNLLRLDQPVDKGEWAVNAHEPNAYYNPSNNEIVFMAAILQSPYFSSIFPKAVNYGGIGSVIGHEITHGFDHIGSQYNKYGVIENWWSRADEIKFRKRKQCVVDQYGQYTVSEVNMNVNGHLTQSENIADMGGLKEAYRAYQKDVEMNGDTEPLPGLQLNNNQLFFVAFAQTHCERSTKGRLITSLQTSQHPPGQFRALGSLQNFEEFSKVFNCPVGSPMNPKKRCVVW